MTRLNPDLSDFAIKFYVTFFEVTYEHVLYIRPFRFLVDVQRVERPSI